MIINYKYYTYKYNKNIIIIIITTIIILSLKHTYHSRIFLMQYMLRIPLKVWSVSVTFYYTQWDTFGRNTLDRRSVRHRGIYLHNTNTAENIFNISGIRTHGPSHRAIADLRLRQHGQWDRFLYRIPHAIFSRYIFYSTFAKTNLYPCYFNSHFTYYIGNSYKYRQ